MGAKNAARIEELSDVIANAIVEMDAYRMLYKLPAEVYQREEASEHER